MSCHCYARTQTHTQPETHLGEVSAEEDQVFLMAQQVSTIPTIVAQGRTTCTLYNILCVLI